MSMSKELAALERLAAGHRRVDGSVDDFCSADDQAWPCDTMVAVGLAVPLEAENRELMREVAQTTQAARWLERSDDEHIRELEAQIRAWKDGHDTCVRRMARAVELLKTGRSFDIQNAIYLLQQPV